MPTIATQKNYRMACTISQIHNAMQVLMEADVAMHDIATNNGQPTIITDPIPETIKAMPLSSVRRAEGTTVRAVLCGCVIEYNKPNSNPTNEVAA